MQQCCARARVVSLLCLTILGAPPQVAALELTNRAARLTAPRVFAPGAAEDASPAEALARVPYVPGHLIVKLKDSTQVGLDFLHAQSQALALALGSAELDDLNHRYGLRTIRPVRHADAALTSGAERERWHAARRAQMAATAAARLGSAARLNIRDGLAATYVFELSPWLDLEQIAREYSGVPAVAYAEPERRAHVLLTPNDPFLSSTGAWGQPFGDLWGLTLIGAPAAWDMAQGAGIVVAVVDTGVDTTHPDIQGNIWTNPGEIPGNGMDDDGNGLIDDVSGWNFVANTNNVFDDFGHGTHVAGTIAAVGQNGVGVIGVAWQSKIMAVKALDAAGYGTTSALADAILYAAENGASVINASWGGTGTSQVISDAVGTANAAGVVFVAAAGNWNADVEDPVAPFFPADDPHAITVAAFDHTDHKASFSNFGSKIDVAAPGGGDAGSGFEPGRSVLSLLSSGANSTMTGSGNLVVGQSYVRQEGTSMAAPHVSGTAALILSAHPSYTAAQVRAALRAGAVDVDSPGVDIDAGYGRINASQSVSLTALAAEITSPSRLAMLSDDNAIPINGTAAGSGFVSYSLEYGPGAFPTSWQPIGNPSSVAVADGALGSWDITDVPDGNYVVRLIAWNSDGVGFEDRVPVTLNRAIITAPSEDSITRAGAPIVVRGTAAGAGFESFVVEYRVTTSTSLTLYPGPWTAAGITLAGGGQSKVFDDALATFDSSLLTDSTIVDFRLTVTTANGPITAQRNNVVFDPTLRPGWPRRVPVLPDVLGNMRNQPTVADLDGDGTKEILVAFGDLVFALRPDGSDLPGWPQSVANPQPDTYIDSGPAVADLDGDGRPEVVTANRDSIFIWHADGTPMAGWPKQFADYDWDTHFNPSGEFTLSDIDGDGTRDIVFAFGELLVALHPDGSYLPGFPVRHRCALISPNCFEHAVAVGDVDGDGRKEIAVLANSVGLYASLYVSQSLYLYGADGQLKRGWPKRNIVRRYVKRNAPIMADVNGDGRLDIIVNTDSATRLRAYDGRGRSIRTQPGRLREFTLNYAPDGTYHSKPEPVVAADINGDGRAELFAGTDFPDSIKRCTWKVCHISMLLPPFSGIDFLNVATAASTPLAGWPVRFDLLQADRAHGTGPPAIGDIDGDGLPDVLVGLGFCARWDPALDFHRCYTMYAFHADGSLIPGFPKATPRLSGDKSISPAIADLDGDGLKEIVLVDYNGNVMVWNVPGIPAPESMQWPMARHDAGHTGALAAP